MNGIGHGRGNCAAEGLELCGAGSVTVGGQVFTANEDTAFIVFRVARSFPALFPDRGAAFHPGTLANSWQTMQGKVFNFGHQMRSYDKEAYSRDRMLGTVMACEFPKTPIGGWRVPKTVGEAPSIRCVAAMHKAAADVPQILGLHQSGRLQWEVSMEVNYNYVDCAFALPAENEEGWEYVPWAEAPADLAKCWGPPPRKKDGAWICTGEYKGRKPVILWGGVPGVGSGGNVRFRGTALVTIGAEPTNQVETILASGDADIAARLALISIGNRIPGLVVNAREESK